MATVARMSAAHFARTKHRVKNEENHQDRQRDNDEQARLGALFTFVFAFPIDVVAARQLNLRVYLANGFLDRAAQVAAAHAVLDRNVALVSFAVDFGTAVAFFDLAELRERNAFAGWGQQANVLDGFLRCAVLREVAQHQVVSRLALQYLGESIASDGGLDRRPGCRRR